MAYIAIYCIDVGQGDSTLVVFKKNKNDEKPDFSVLIDVGASEEAAISVIAFCKKKLFQSRLDAIIITHMHSDHIGGAKAQGFAKVTSSEEIMGHNTGIYTACHSDDAANYFDPLHASSKRYSDFEKEFNTKQMQAGQFRFPFPGTFIFEKSQGENINERMSIQFISANSYIYNMNTNKAEKINGSDSDTQLANTYSVGVLIKCGNFSYFTAGDLAGSQELYFVNNLPEGFEINAWKISHHGAKTATKLNVFNRMRKPFPAILTSGYNPHQHPQMDILERIRLENGRVYKTGLRAATIAFDPEVPKRPEEVNYKKDEQCLQRCTERGNLRAPGTITLRHQGDETFFTVSYDKPCISNDQIAIAEDQAVYNKVMETNSTRQSLWSEIISILTDLPAHKSHPAQSVIHDFAVKNADAKIEITIKEWAAWLTQYYTHAHGLEFSASVNAMECNTEHINTLIRFAKNEEEQRKILKNLNTAISRSISVNDSYKSFARNITAHFRGINITKFIDTYNIEKNAGGIQPGIPKNANNSKMQKVDPTVRPPAERGTYELMEEPTEPRMAAVEANQKVAAFIQSSGPVPDDDDTDSNFGENKLSGSDGMLSEDDDMGSNKDKKRMAPSPAKQEPPEKRKK